MKRIFILVSAICFNFFAAPTLAQNLYKCEDAQGKLEYRNAPCDAAQKNAGSVKGGSVTTMKSSDTASASSAANKAGNAGNVSNAASAPNSLQEKAAALMKSLKVKPRRLTPPKSRFAAHKVNTGLKAWAASTKRRTTKTLRLVAAKCRKFAAKQGENTAVRLMSVID